KIERNLGNLFLLHVLLAGYVSHVLILYMVQPLKCPANAEFFTLGTQLFNKISKLWRFLVNSRGTKSLTVISTWWHPLVVLVEKLSHIHYHLIVSLLRSQWKVYPHYVMH